MVQSGGGAAWLRDPIVLGNLLRDVRKAIKAPLTIKIRSGWDENSINAKEVTRIAADNGVAWVAIHARTKAQGYSGLSDWNLIREIAQESQIPVVGNGDLVTWSEARRKLEGGYAHAVMIGRGVLKNPWLFEEILQGHEITPDFPSLVIQHFSLMCSNRGNIRAAIALRKFMAWYATGYPGAKQFRRSIFQLKDIDELREYSVHYFSGLIGIHRRDDSEGFLMGGEG